MINNIYKRIHNRYSKFFNFFFFLRYVIGIFLIAIVSFILIPKFFDYEKKQLHIKNYLIQHYNFNISNIEKIQFNIFPLPNLEISEATLNLDKNSQIKTKKICQSVVLKPAPDEM